MKHEVKTIIRKLDKEFNIKNSQMMIRFVDSPLNLGKSWEDEEGNLHVESLDVNFDDIYFLNGEKVSLRIYEGRQAFFTQSDRYAWDFKVFIHDLERNKFKLELFISKSKIVYLSNEKNMFRYETHEQLQKEAIKHDIVISDNVTIGNGSMIGYSVTIGDYSTIEADVMIGYEVAIGGYSTINEGARIESNITMGCCISIGNNVKVRCGTVIRSQSKIGNDSTIYHGVIIRDSVIVENNVTIWNFATIENGVTIPARTIVEAGCIVKSS